MSDRDYKHIAIVLVLIFAVTGLLGYIDRSHIDVVQPTPYEVGISCPDGHNPQIVGMEEQTLIVTCQ